MRSNKWMLMSCFCRKLCAADNSCVCSLLCQINAAVVFPGLFIVLEHWCLAGLDSGVSKQQIKGFAVILFWLGFIYLSPGLWGCLWMTFSSWSGKESLAWQDGVVKLVIGYLTDPCWSGGERGLHRFITDKVSGLDTVWVLIQESGEVIASPSLCFPPGAPGGSQGNLSPDSWDPVAFGPRKGTLGLLLFLEAHRLQVLGSLRAGIKLISCSVRTWNLGTVLYQLKMRILLWFTSGTNWGCNPWVFLTSDGKTMLTNAKLSCDKILVHTELGQDTGKDWFIFLLWWV